MKRLPRIQFAHLPTRVEPLSRLSSILNGPSIYIKRDDQTGLAMGGNKSRKLEFLIAEAKAQGAKMLITAGAMQSNHCRQTAAAAALFGFECQLVLISPKGKSQSADQFPQASGNLLLDLLFGAEIIWCNKEDRETVLDATFKDAWISGQRPYLIPYGGSNPIGATGYVYAMQELIEQEVESDWIVFPSSSGGTQAGLTLGAREFGFSGSILGISVDEPADILAERVAQLATQTADTLGIKATFSSSNVNVNADYLGGGYGVMSEIEKESIKLFAQNEGILLDPVYTGRAAAGMIDLIRKGFFTKDQSVLFWHTGGTPALFAQQYQNEI